MDKIKKGYYTHFKDKDTLYEVLGVAHHSETMEKMVVYRHVGGEKNGMTFVRPLEMFIEKVPEGKENPTGQEYRFEYVEDSSDMNG